MGIGGRIALTAAALALAPSLAPAHAATITTVAGVASASGTYSGEGVAATTAQLNAPRGIAATPDGGFLLADEGNAVVRRVDPRGVITRVAGRAQDAQDTSGDGLRAVDAHLRQPRGVAALLGGGFLVADRGDGDGGRVRRVDPFGDISTFAGTDAACAALTPCGDGGPATSATLTAPAAVLALTDGRVVIADGASNRVRVVSAGGTITTLAGTGTACGGGACGDGAAAASAQLNAPAGLAVEADGAILIADAGDDRIRRVSPDGVITTVAGSNGSLNNPTGVAVAPDGSIIVADSSNQVVRRLTPGGTLTTLAGIPGLPCGDPAGAACGDGGDATATRLLTPFDVAVTPDGDVLVADHNTQRVRRIDSNLRAPIAAGQRAGAVTVDGNRLRSGGAPLRLLGASRGALGDACTFGGIQDGPLTSQSAAVMAGWFMTAVRLPVNQDCWLGAHGLPVAGSGTAAAYRQRVVDYVHTLEQQGLAVVLDNQFGSVPLPGTGSVFSPPLPDATALAFLSSLAQTFRDDDDVLFDVYNEPHPDSTGDGFNLANVPAWTCWRDGCGRRWITPDGATVEYAAVGMQAMVDAVRATGASQPILAGGISYASDLSGWLAHRPVDPAGQLVAALHFYEFLPGTVFGGEGRTRPPDTPVQTPAEAAAARTAAWDATLAPIAATVPLVAGELGEFDCDHDFSDQFFDWADAHGVSYLAWTWNAEDGDGDGSGDGYWFCDGGTGGGRGGPALIERYDGTPTAFGAGLRNRLKRLQDRTDPLVTISVPQPGQHVARGAALASQFSCRDEDGGSGLRSCSGAALVDTSVTGTRTFTVTAVDENGNGATSSVQYVVDAPPPPSPPAQVLPPAAVARAEVLSTARVPAAIRVTRAGGLTVPLACTGALRCRGVVRLARTVRGRVTTITTGRYDIAPARRAAVKLKLTRAGRALLLASPGGRLGVRLTIVPRGKAVRPRARSVILVAPRRPSP